MATLPSSLAEEEIPTMPNEHPSLFVITDRSTRKRTFDPTSNWFRSHPTGIEVEDLEKMRKAEQVLDEEVGRQLYEEEWNNNMSQDAGDKAWREDLE